MEKGEQQAKEWPPKGFVAVGDYAFKPPYVPTETQIAQVEEFIYTQPEFLGLSEVDIHRCSLHLAMAAATNPELGEEDGSHTKKYIFVADRVIEMVVIRHEGSVIIFSLKLLDLE